MSTRRVVFAALALIPWALKAQDERRVASPNGQLELRLFVGQPKDGLWPRIGYQVAFHGQPFIVTSWLGLDIRDQEPFLAENAGLSESDAGSKAHYNWLVAHFMQNGSLGRRLDIEVRAYDDAVTFRYIIPRSTPLEEILIRDEETDFNFAQPGVLKHLTQRSDIDLPFVAEQPGIGWVIINAAGPNLSKYPLTYLIRSADGLRTNLARSKQDPTVAFTGTTPLTWPWRVILIGPDKEHLLRSEALNDLNR